MITPRGSGSRSRRCEGEASLRTPFASDSIGMSIMGGAPPPAKNRHCVELQLLQNHNGSPYTGMNVHYAAAAGFSSAHFSRDDIIYLLSSVKVERTGFRTTSWAWHTTLFVEQMVGVPLPAVGEQQRSPELAPSKLHVECCELQAVAESCSVFLVSGQFTLSPVTTTAACKRKLDIYSRGSEFAGKTIELDEKHRIPPQDHNFQSVITTVGAPVLLIDSHQLYFSFIYDLCCPSNEHSSVVKRMLRCRNVLHGGRESYRPCPYPPPATCRPSGLMVDSWASTCLLLDHSAFMPF
ncbi:hypothetical protein J6590_007011 [Homalodisca vitripennis]|nr:hypothetical protein J6590_007011 [Homalodisca vitripennis]